MKIAFFSNFLNHHQLPMCLSFHENEQVEFKFVACTEIPEYRINMGYADLNKEYSFVVRAYEDEEAAKKIAETYDVVIFGDAPITYLALRMNKKLLTFRFAERSLKKGTWRRFIPTTRKKIYDGYTRYKNNNLFILGASAYTAHDLVLCGFNKEKCFRWGYFPEIVEKDISELFELKQENSITQILYAGRLLPLKHVMDIVKSVHNLVNEGKKIHFTIIGDGESKQEISQYIETNNISEYFTMLPFVSPEEVREYMDRADIYVFSSNFYEGWGAVVNEAMNSACAVVVSHAVGSAAYLINHKENGYIYEFANIEQLTSCLSELVLATDYRRKIGESAYNTVKTTWSASNATARFYKLCDALINNREYKSLYSEGPCSLAPIYKNNWFKG